MDIWFLFFCLLIFFTYMTLSTFISLNLLFNCTFIVYNVCWIAIGEFFDDCWQLQLFFLYILMSFDYIQFMYVWAWLGNSGLESDDMTLIVPAKWYCKNIHKLCGLFDFSNFTINVSTLIFHLLDCFVILNIKHVMQINNTDYCIRYLTNIDIHSNHSNSWLT